MWNLFPLYWIKVYLHDDIRNNIDPIADTDGIASN